MWRQTASSRCLMKTCLLLFVPLLAPAADLQTAIDVVAARGGGVVVVTAGRHVTGTLTLKSNITLRLDAGATLVGSRRIEDYNPRHLIYARDAENIAIEGEDVMLKPEEGFARGVPAVADTVLGWRFVNRRFPDRYTVTLGETAELITRVGHGKSRAQICGADVLRALGHRCHGREALSREEPSGGARECAQVGGIPCDHRRCHHARKNDDRGVDDEAHRRSASLCASTCSADSRLAVRSLRARTRLSSASASGRRASSISCARK